MSLMASMANAVAAMRPSSCATAACLPTGAPHCSRSAAHSREIFTHDRDAWLVAPDEARALAQGLRAVLADDALRARLARALAARAPQHTWDARAARLLAWMESRA